MKPVDFDYERPATIAEATALLARHGNAKVMAGGQTLGPMLNLRLAQPELIVDIRAIPELTRVADDAAALVLGACTTHAAIEDGRVPDTTRGMLQRVASHIAYRAVRTRGTIGGSLSHADPAADWVSCLTALDATVSISSPRGTRRSALTSFMRGVMDTELAPDEILDAIAVPRLSAAARWGYHKICRKTGEFAEAIGAVVVDRDRCRIVAGATSGRPVVIDLEAEAVSGRKWAALDIPARLTAAGLDGDFYQLRLHAAAVRRALEEAIPQ
jgi:aerobic carbon-monoxide dehydrogenase medium subunit